MIKIESGTKFSELPVIAGRMGRCSTLSSSKTSGCIAPTSNRVPNKSDNVKVCVWKSRTSSICFEDAIMFFLVKE